MTNKNFQLERGLTINGLEVIDGNANASFNKVTSNGVDLVSLAQSAFDKANTVASGNSTDNWARTQANASYSQANTSYTQANTGTTLAQSAFNKANTTTTLAQNAFNKANSSTLLAQAAFDKANTGGSSGTFGTDEWARAKANLALESSNTSLLLAQNSYDQSNSTLLLAQNSYAQSNSTLLLAQASFDSSNTKVSSSGGTINGSITIAQDLTVSGNLLISGNATTISSNNVNIDDPLIYLAQGNPANLNDIGIVGHFTSNRYQHTGLVRDHLDSTWKFFSNSISEPTNTVNFNEPGIIYDSIKVGTIISNGQNLNNQINLIFNRANTTAIATQASFDKVNTTTTLTQSAFNQANTAYNSAIASFNKANTTQNTVTNLVSTVDTHSVEIVDISTKLQNAVINYDGSTYISGNLLVTQTVSANDFQLVSSVPNSYGSAYFNNGSYLRCDTNQWPTGYSDFTMEAWVYLTNNNPGYASHIVGGMAGNQNSVFMQLGFNYGPFAALSVGISDVVSEHCNFTFENNTWYHVAAMRQGGLMKFFVNGQQRTTVQGNFGNNYVGASYLSAIDRVFVGNSGDQIYPLYGNLYGVRVTNYAIYTTDFTPSLDLNNNAGEYFLLKFKSPALFTNDDGVNGTLWNSYNNAIWSPLNPSQSLRYTIANINDTLFAAYDTANTALLGSASSGLSSYAANTANAAFITANSAFAAANAAGSNAMVLYAANTANAAFITANSSTTLAQAAFNKANTGSLTTTSNVQFLSFGVGTPPSNSFGEIRAAGEVTAYYSSDETLKENIITIDNALGKLKQVRGVMYDWKDSVIQSRGGLDDYFVRKHDTGVIAQEIEKVLPEVVAERPDGTKAVRYEKLAGIIIQAINELAEQVEELKNK